MNDYANKTRSILFTIPSKIAKTTFSLRKDGAHRWNYTGTWFYA